MKLPSDLLFSDVAGRFLRTNPVQKMLGHASAAMTLDVYTHLFEDDLDAVRPATR